MSLTEHCTVLALALCAGCGGLKPSLRPVEPAPRAEPRASTEVTRLAEIAQVDLEAQEQLARVDALSVRLETLQRSLSGALARDPSAHESVATAETAAVRVRLSDDLLFAAASSRITRHGRRALDHVAEVLRGDAVEKVEVAGHTDDVPIARKYIDNWDLSTTRARAVVEYLVAHQVDPRRLRLIGYADTQPLAPGTSSEARARNRRVELLVTPSPPREQVTAR